MSDRFSPEEFDDATDLVYSVVDKFVNDDNELFQMHLLELTNLAYLQGWGRAIDMVINVVGEMYNGDTFDNPTLEELRQRIV
jgi:hypothetical protein